MIALDGFAPFPGCRVCDIPGHSTPGCRTHPLPLADLTVRGDALMILDAAARRIARHLPPLPGEDRSPPSWYVSHHPHDTAPGVRMVNLRYWEAIRATLELWRVRDIPEPVLPERRAA